MFTIQFLCFEGGFIQSNLASDQDNARPSKAYISSGGMCWLWVWPPTYYAHRLWCAGVGGGRPSAFISGRVGISDGDVKQIYVKLAWFPLAFF